MYVFRPQQEIGHSCSRGSERARGPHHNVGRQAAKNQRRTQPKLRRPQAQQRRRQMLRDIVCAGHAGHRARLAQEPAANVGVQGGDPHVIGNFDDPDIDACLDDRTAHGSRRKGGVRARLRARLVQRSVTELVDVLERRHGRQWPEHVLRGDFHAFESMRRICEAFCLRPDLERQVLKVAADRARAYQSGEVTSVPPRKARSHNRVQASVESDGGFEDGIQNPSAAFRHFSCFEATLDMEEKTRHRKNLLQTKRDEWHESSLFQETASTSDGGSVAGTLDGASSEVTSVDDGLEQDAMDDFDIGIPKPMPSMEVGDAILSTSKEALNAYVGGHASSESETTEPEAPKSWSTSWRMRVLRVLGLQRSWSQGHAGSVAVVGAKGQQVVEVASANAEAEPMPRQDHDGIESEEEDEVALSSKLVAAVRNAERHAAVTQSARVLRASPSTSAEDLTIAHSKSKAERAGHQRQGASGDSSVNFSKESEVSFFSENASDASNSEAACLEYRRSLYTKTFDGPSGHKAKRTPSHLKGWLSDDEEVASRTMWGTQTSEDSEEDEEEWEDMCDDIAELMCQPRSCLLWSASW